MFKQLMMVGAAALAIAGTTSAQTGMGSQSTPNVGSTPGSSNATTGGVAATGEGTGMGGTDRTSTSSMDPGRAEGVGNSPRSSATDYGTTSTAMSSPQGPDGLTWQNGQWTKNGKPATKAQVTAHKKWMADNGISAPTTR